MASTLTDAQKAARARKAAKTRQRKSDLAEQSVAELRAQAKDAGVTGTSGMNKASLISSIVFTERKGRAPRARVTVKGVKQKIAQQRASRGVRHGKGPFRLVLIKNNAVYGNMGPYATGRAALADGKSLLRRMAPIGDYALSNTEAQGNVGGKLGGATIIDGYIAQPKHDDAPDINAAAFAIQFQSKADADAYVPSNMPLAVRNNGRRKKPRHKTRKRYSGTRANPSVQKSGSRWRVTDGSGVVVDGLKSKESAQMVAGELETYRRYAGTGHHTGDIINGFSVGARHGYYTVDERARGISPRGGRARVVAADLTRAAATQLADALNDTLR